MLKEKKPLKAHLDVKKKRKETSDGIYILK